jgi:hypothetical protein
MPAFYRKKDTDRTCRAEMMEEKRKMDPLVKPEDDGVWGGKDDGVWGAKDDGVWGAAIDDTCQLSCPTMIYRGFEEILIGQPKVP